MAMASRKKKWMAAGGTIAVAGLAIVAYQLFAAQGQGVLAQAPLNDQVQTAPAFIMAVDDSGSMTFQTQFPATDGTACWNRDRRSFFQSAGVLNTTGSTCNYFYVLPGPRVNSYYGIPPIDSMGFARSAAYNPTYFNPAVKYDPWVRGDGTSYPDANVVNTPIDPRETDTVTLSSETYLNTAAGEFFRMQDGMYLAPNTVFRYTRNGQNYTSGTNGYTWADGNDYNVWVRYRPSTFFLPYTSDADPWPTLNGDPIYSSLARVLVANACGQGCSMWKYSITKDDVAALQNFANWYTYYGNRNRAIIAGMTRSLSTVNNLRVGYFRINQNGDYDGTQAAKRLTMRNMGDGGEKAALYNDMIALTASGGTPNRQAVNAASIQFTRTDSGAPIQLACQKNAVMLFTDGFSNDGGPTVGNNDSGMGVPFQDGNSDTLADIAAKYYNNVSGASPLRTDLTAGQVPVPQACKDGTADKRTDCQTNLHLNFYGVTLGARGNLFDPDRDQDPFTDSTVYSNWPSRQDNNRSTIDDIWHASVNTRGEYINARTPAEITSAMSRILQTVTTGGSLSGTRGVTGARIGAGSLSVAPEYQITNEGTDWYSRLKASTIAINPTTRVAELTEIWDAANQIPAAASRSIFVNKAGTVSEFNATNVSLADLCTKTGDNPGMSLCTEQEITGLGVNRATVISYLRGEASSEKRMGGKLRDRTTRLGDIVTSSPVVSSPNDDFGYRRLGGTLASSYQAYLTEKRRLGGYRVYAGANDGMLHAFDGGLDANGNAVAGGGRELFGYIPSTSVGHMGNLVFPYNKADVLGQKFQHRYYVDGQIAVGDTRYGEAWKSTLVGASGAGGRSVFALDVTPGTTFAAGSRLWEISDLDTSLPLSVRNNIGNVLSRPVIVPMLQGTTQVWRAIFGNGYNSKSGKAVLFMVDIGTGTPTVRMIEAVEAASTVPPGGSNGLGTVVVLDRSGGPAGQVRDGYADTAYGTDQKGAVWKFDLNNVTATTGTAGAGATITVPFFTTNTFTENNVRQRQAITGGTTVTIGRRGGVMLLFGTGSFSFVGDDNDTTSVQSLYGVEDVSAGAVGTTVTRSTLQGGSVTTSGASRTLTQQVAPANAVGWYVDLPAGERFVANPTIASGIVYMPTYAPSPTTRGCSAVGSNWLFGLNTLGGAGAMSQARVGSPDGPALPAGTAGVKLEVPGTSPVRDVPVLTLPRAPLTPYSAGTEPPKMPPGGSACWMVPKGGTVDYYVPYPCGRQSWRQIQ